jgi:hypothetical protein
MQIKKIALYALLLISIVSAGCNSSSSSGPSTPADARVVIVHSSPTAPAVNVVIDNDVIQQGGTPLTVTYNTNIPILSVAAGSRRVRLRVPTTPPIDAVDVPSFNFAAGGNFTLIAVDTVQRISALALTDNFTTAQSGQAGVRFLHLSPDARNVDFLTFEGSIIAPQNITVVSANRAFNKTATAEQAAFVSVPTTRQLGFRVTGETQISVITLPTGGLTAGGYFSACVVGLINRPSTNAQFLATLTFKNN